MTLSPDTVLQQRYKIVRTIGSGGFGAVYEAKDLRLGHRVALKQLTLGGTQVQQAFEREARILARLKHAALPKVSDHFMDANNYFLVMEYIEGDDFKALLEQRHAPFLLSQVLKWADQLLDALEYLHNEQPSVIHRDIKPGNIKLSPEGKIYLIDFGIAKGGNINTYQAISGASIYAFSPCYASMEQIEGKGTDARSDLYSLGVTLHHLLTGVVPPQTVSRANEKAMNRADPLRPVNELNPQVPASVARVLSQATEFDPNLRPKSARAMRNALERAVSSQTQAPAPSTEAISTQINNLPSTFPDLATLPKWGIIVGVLLLLLVGAMGGRILFGGSSDTASEGSKATEVAVISTQAPPTATEISETEIPAPTEITTEVATPMATATEIPAPTATETPVEGSTEDVSPLTATPYSKYTPYPTYTAYPSVTTDPTKNLELPSPIGECNQEIYWGDIDKYFNIYDVECKNIEKTDSVLNFPAEAKGSFEGTFYAEVYDSYGLQLCINNGGSIIECHGDYLDSGRHLDYIGLGCNYKSGFCDKHSWNEGEQDKVVIKVPYNASEIHFGFQENN